MLAPYSRYDRLWDTYYPYPLQAEIMRETPEYLLSEQPAIALLKQLGYEHLTGIPADARENTGEVILHKHLLTALVKINPWINEYNLHKVYQTIAHPQGNSLMEINEQIWTLLRGGTMTVKQVIDGKEDWHPVFFIDYQNLSNNHFLVINQPRYRGKGPESEPDLVIYVNGLPLVVIECKSPKLSSAKEDAYKNLVHYQQNSEKLFYYNLMCVGLWKDGARYGAIQAPMKFYSVFKLEKKQVLPALGAHPSAQAILLYSLFQKEVLLDLLRHFVIFEAEDGTVIKKLPRYQQLRATNKSIARLQSGKGGVVWHTQGSGKSITMAYLTRKLQAEEFGFDNPTVLIMTDRKDLDLQIFGTFTRIGFNNLSKANSKAALQQLLRNDYGGIITTTIQKFQEIDPNTESSSDQTAEEEDAQDTPNDYQTRIKKQIDGKILTKITQQFVNKKWVEIKRETIELEELSNKQNLYVLVDEAHRSHYGFLAAFMRTSLPQAKFVAFTGTPISKAEKSTLAEFYGGEYIDVYTIKESVADGATVELLYDQGIERIEVEKERLDAKFEELYKDKSLEEKEARKKLALKKYQLSDKRIDLISRHIINHYRDKIYPDKHKAMLVCTGREAAIAYKKTFERLRAAGVHDFESKVVISLGTSKSLKDIDKEYYQAIKWNKEHPQDKKPIWMVEPHQIKTVTDLFKLPFGEESDKAKSGKVQYNNTAFLIVSDMLLTGYDAPIAACLYLDKSLREHGLLQAIARVNRARKGKAAGFIMDYQGISENLIEALEIFSGDLQRNDIMKNLSEEIPLLDMHRAKLVDFFKALKIDRRYDREDYIDAAIRYLDPIDKKDAFKKLLKQFNKSVNIVLPDQRAMAYEPDFKLFNEINLRSRDETDKVYISEEESQMLLALINKHLKASGIEHLLEEPVSILDKEKFQQEIEGYSEQTKELKMRNKLKHTIRVGIHKNPDFYKPLAERLEQLLKQREEQQITGTQLILAFTQLTDSISKEEQAALDLGFDTEGKKAVFSSMKALFENEEDAIQHTQDLLAQLAPFMQVVEWKKKSQSISELEKQCRKFLRNLDFERAFIRTEAVKMVKLLKQE